MNKLIEKVKSETPWAEYAALLWSGRDDAKSANRMRELMSLLDRTFDQVRADAEAIERAKGLMAPESDTAKRELELVKLACPYLFWSDGKPLVPDGLPFGCDFPLTVKGRPAAVDPRLLAIDPARAYSADELEALGLSDRTLKRSCLRPIGGSAEAPLFWGASVLAFARAINVRYRGWRRKQLRAQVLPFSEGCIGRLPDQANFSARDLAHAGIPTHKLPINGLPGHPDSMPRAETISFLEEFVRMSESAKSELARMDAEDQAVAAAA